MKKSSSVKEWVTWFPKLVCDFMKRFLLSSVGRTLQQFVWPTSGVLESNHHTAQITEAKQAAGLVSPHGWCESASSRDWNHISFSSENRHAVRKSIKMKKDRWVKADSTLGFLNSLKIVHKHIPPSSSVWRFAWGQRTHHDLIVLIVFTSSESPQMYRASCSGISVFVFITLPTAPPSVNAGIIILFIYYETTFMAS